MNKQSITFSASEQTLEKTGGIDNYASNIVSYVEATFTLGENWTGYDVVRAVWESAYAKISTVLDSDHKCVVPAEVLRHKSKVNVNLVGSIVTNDVLTDRLTTYPVHAITVDADARVDSTETQPITPSQFEQFVEAVHADAESIQDYSYDSEAWAKGTRGGVAVPSTDPTYHNNSKYYADQGAELEQEVSDLKSDLNAIQYGGFVSVALSYPNEDQYVKPNNGDLASATNWHATDYIDISNAAGSIFYNVSTVTGNYNAFYDEDFAFISDFGETVYGTIAIPTNAKYVRLSCRTTDSITFKLGVIGQRENLAISYPHFDNYYIDNGNGSYRAYNDWTATELIPVSKDFIEIHNVTKASTYNAFYDINKKFVSAFSLAVGDNKIAVPTNARYYALSNTTEDLEAVFITNPSEYIASEKSNTYIKVANYNVGLFNDGITKVATSDAVEQMIKFRKIIGSIDADIMNVQEFLEKFDDGNTYDASTNVMDFKYPFNTKGVLASGSLGFSKLNINNPKVVYFANNSGRYYVEYSVIINGEMITVINAHLSSQRDASQYRANEIQELITEMNTKQYVVLTGDFNVSSQSEFDAFKTAGYKLCNGGDFGWFDTWPIYENMPSEWSTDWPCNNLDNIIVSSNIVPQYVEAFECDISDHAPLVAELRIE